MDINLLKYFIVAARTEHMTRAAEELHITQPSLTAAIRRMERELGYPLFSRNGRSVQLNEYGALFYEACLQIDGTMTECLQKMKALEKKKNSFVRLCCSSSTVNSGLVDELSSGGDQREVGALSNQWKTQLKSGETDFVITFALTQDTALEKEVLCLHEIVTVAGNAHPLAGKATVTAAELSDYPFCSINANRAILNVASEQLHAYGIHPKAEFFGRDSSDMLKAIRTGRFLGLMVKQNLPKDDELVILPMKGFHLQLPLYLYWRAQERKNPLQVSVRDIARKFYRETYSGKT
ncbi:MAG: LysR family transcriptional regulator [Clostridiales bacterium]|nr:LysR family transcriptional regulator [Clostridiales bacterium]